MRFSDENIQYIHLELPQIPRILQHVAGDSEPDSHSADLYVDLLALSARSPWTASQGAAAKKG